MSMNNYEIYLKAFVHVLKKYTLESFILLFHQKSYLSTDIRDLKQLLEVLRKWQRGPQRSRSSRGLHHLL